MISAGKSKLPTILAAGPGLSGSAFDVAPIREIGRREKHAHRLDARALTLDGSRSSGLAVVGRGRAQDMPDARRPRRRSGPGELGSILYSSACRLDPTDPLLQVVQHLEGREPFARARPHGEHCVTAPAKRIEHLGPLVIVDLAAVREPGAARHVDDRQAVAVPVGVKISISSPTPSTSAKTTSCCCLYGDSAFSGAARQPRRRARGILGGATLATNSARERNRATDEAKTFHSFRDSCEGGNGGEA